MVFRFRSTVIIYHSSSACLLFHRQSYSKHFCWFPLSLFAGFTKANLGPRRLDHPFMAAKRTVDDDLQNKSTKRIKVSTSSLSEDTIPALPLDASGGSFENPTISTKDEPGSEGIPSKGKQRVKSIKRSKSVGYAKPDKREGKEPQRRNRRGTRNHEAAIEQDPDGVQKAPRLPKRQCALLIGFRGSGYRGMQMFVGPCYI
jgi:hypothetical protein